MTRNEELTALRREQAIMLGSAGVALPQFHQAALCRFWWNQGRILRILKERR